MKIKPIFRYYFKVWLITTLLVSSFAILIDIAFPVAVDLINGANWKTDFLASEGFTQAIWLVFIIVIASPLKKIFTLGAQFNISRKTQYTANLIGIVFFAVTWILLFRVLYPILLDYLFYYTDDMWKYTLASTLPVNFWLTRLVNAIGLVLLGLVVWFCMAQTKRFSLVPVIFVTLVIIVLVPVILIGAMGIIPTYIQNDMMNTFQVIYTSPIGFWVSLSVLLLLALYIVRRATRTLSMK